MDAAFAQALENWSAFYTLMGGAAATLLGLLFVALSLRLNLFHQREVADVRAFAAFTFGTFLVVIIIAALVLAPHEERTPLAVALAIIAVGGLAAATRVAREWMRLNEPMVETHPGYTADQWQGWVYAAAMGAGYAGLLVVADLVRTGDPGALGWLAIVAGWHLMLGTVSAWLLLSHAGASQGDAGAALNVDALPTATSRQVPQLPAPASEQTRLSPTIVQTPRSPVRGRQSASGSGRPGHINQPSTAKEP